VSPPARSPSLAQHHQRVLPRDVEARVADEYGNPKRAIGLSGAMYIRSKLPVARPDLALCNAVNLYPVRAHIGLPAGHTLLSAPHPLEYLPYQYEGHTPRERQLLRTHDISGKLVALDNPKAVPDLQLHKHLFGNVFRDA
jgi:hypothetical protein